MIVNTAYAPDVGADMLVWLSWNLGSIAALGLEAEDFPNDEQRRVYGWLCEMREDGVEFETPVEAWDRAYEGGGKVFEQYAAVVDTLSATSLPMFTTSHSCNECGHLPNKLPEMLSKARVLRRHRARMAAMGEMDKLEAAAGSPEEFQRAMEEAQARITDLTRSAEDMAPMLPSRIVLQSDESGDASIDLGWPILNRRMGGGLPRKDILVLVGCPSVGKTCWALNVIEGVLFAHPDEHVVFFSLEMPDVEVHRRHLISWTKTTVEQLRNCMAGKEEWPYPAFTPAGFDRVASRYHIFETERTIPKMMRRLAGVGRISLVVVDYIQRMSRPQARNTVDVIEQNMHDLKSMAKSFDCGVVALSQIPRDKGDPWDPVSMRAGKGSSAIEEVADYMVGIWRPDFQTEQETKREICKLRLGLVKNRHSFVGRQDTSFDVVRQRITEGSPWDFEGGHDHSEGDSALFD